MLFPINISKEDILAVIEQIDRTGIPPDAVPDHYEVVYNNRHYPPKLLIDRANQNVNSNGLDINSLEDGIDSPVFQILDKAGFDLFDIPSGESLFFRFLLLPFLNQAANTDDLKSASYIKTFKGLQVKVSFGKGIKTKMPWIVFLKEGQTVQKGIYPAYLFDLNKNLLILSYCISETYPPDDKWVLPEGSETIAAYYKRQYQQSPFRYGSSYIYKVYHLQSGEWFGLNDKEILEDINNIIEKYTHSVSASPLPLINKTIKAPTVMPNVTLNTILYGPPGTGKTYNTINKALQILGIDVDNMERGMLKETFEQKVQEGQIVFATFHQSLSYEDFIEGIKPVTINNEVTYEVLPGIFKTLCTRAKQKEVTANNFEKAYASLLQEIKQNNGALVLETLVHAKEFTVYENSKGNVRFHANTEKANEGVLKKEYIEHFLKTGEAIDWPSYVKAISKYLETKHNYSQKEVAEKKNYVLIIDEINRGNVSQIFGELITLIEDDKRLGRSEALEVVLPYSKERFGVPDNVYILGTMNTADRSVEALDTALRRRFNFAEMMPSPELLDPAGMMAYIWNKEEYVELKWDNRVWREAIDPFYEMIGVSREVIESPFHDNLKDFYSASDFRPLLKDSTGVNLKELLMTINKRIEKLLDRDHLIGHAYFIQVRSLSMLSSVFYNKIIPLLQEYFYGDYGKIGLVLGKGFIREKVSNEVESLFASFDYDTDGIDERKVYEILDYRQQTTYDIKLEGKEIEEVDFPRAIQLLLNQ